jgi:MerR family transcriptional regulator, copper efflux regulator
VNHVTSGYKIKEVADRTGFTPATLRYYEDIGLLPAAQRTASGYRVYDDTTLERLGFVARAKALGCSLDEINELSIAWQGGECGPVQDRLRDTVADRLQAAQRQIAELASFCDDLRAAAESLERHRPTGPCDDRCGCLGGPTGVADRTRTAPIFQAISLTSKPVEATSTGRPTAGSAPIACTLGSHAEIARRLNDWHVLLGHVVRRDPIDCGMRATFGSSVPLTDLIRLTAAEQSCCQFLDFAITVDSRGLALEVTSQSDAAPIIESMFGEPS